MGEFMFAEDAIAENDKAARFTIDGCPPLHGSFFGSDDHRDADGPATEAISPATVAKPDLEGGRDSQQAPSILGFDEHTESAATGDIVGIAGNGKELVKRGVADGELCTEHAVHPAGGA